MKGYTDSRLEFLTQAHRNYIAVGLVIASLFFYWLMLSPTAFPGTSTNLTAVCLGIEPQRGPGHALWLSCVYPARFLPTGWAVYALNLWSALCGALSVGLLFRFLSRWVQESILPTYGLSERTPQLAGLAAGLTGALAFATCLPVWVASTSLSMGTFHALLLLLAFNLLQDNQDRGDRWRPLALALLCGIGCVETTFFWLMAPFFMVVLLLKLYKREQAKWGLIAAIALVGVLGTTLYFLLASQFISSDGFSDINYLGGLALVLQLLKIQLMELREFLPATGWFIVLIMVFLPWIVIQFKACKSYSRGQEVSSLGFHTLLVFLVLPVQFNTPLLPWADSLPEGHLPVLEMMLTAMTLGYLTSFWVLRLLELPDVIDDDSAWRSCKRNKRERPRKLLRIMSGTILALVLFFILVAAVRNIKVTDGRNGSFVDSYVNVLLDQLTPDSWLVTDGLIDTHLALAARERGRKIEIINLVYERNPLQIRRLSNVIQTDPAFAGSTVRYCNAVRLGCATFLQEWLESDSSGTERVAFYAPPDLLFESGLYAQADRLIFRGVKDIEALRSRPLLEENQAFWLEMEKILAGPVTGGALNTLRAALRRRVSMSANNLGVLLEDLGRPEDAISAYERALDFDPDNFSAMLNVVVVTRKGVKPRAAETAELAAADALRKLKQRPDSRNLARFYGYVRVPGEFARQSSEWMRFGRPKLAEASLKRAMGLAPTGTINPLLHELAFLHLSNSRPKESEAAFMQVLKNAPSDTRALLGMVHVSNMRQDHQAARVWLDKAANAGVLETQVSLERAMIDLAEGKYADAYQRLQSLTDGNPAFLEAWALQANLLILQGKVKEAERDILPRMKKISSNTPQYITAVTEAYILRSKGPQFLKASRELYLLALRLQPSSRSVLSEILKIDYSLRDQRATELHAGALLRLDRDDPLANYVLGVLLIGRGELDGAEEHLHRSAASTPSVPVLNDWAEVLRRQGKLDKAEQVIRQALVADPKSPVALDTLACILMDAGRLSEAQESSKIARAIAPQALALKLTAVRILALSGGDPIEGRELVRQLTLQADQLSIPEREALAQAAQKFKKK